MTAMASYSGNGAGAYPSLFGSSSVLGGGGHNSTATTSTGVHHFNRGCVDLRGQAIPHGYLFAPGPDECQICTCVDGGAALCRTVLCAPPQNCRSLRVGDQCCQWICLDEDGDRHGGDGGHRGGGGGGEVADVKLRLVASCLTAVLSIALLFFLIYR